MEFPQMLAQFRRIISAHAQTFGLNGNLKVGIAFVLFQCKNMWKSSISLALWNSLKHQPNLEKEFLHRIGPSVKIIMSNLAHPLTFFGVKLPQKFCYCLF